MASVVVNGRLDVEAVRSHFPALQQNQVFLDNAGGSQILSDAIHSLPSSIRTYFEETNVQLGASYNVGQKATQKYNQGLQAAAQFVNANADEIGTIRQTLGISSNLSVIGPSTTQLFSNLSQAFALSFPDDAEIICSALDHEANISPWVRLAKTRNLKVQWWTPSGGDLKLTAENLRPFMSDKTKLVTCTHTSNILGTIHDIGEIADEVHKTPGAMLCVDGVAYAPHREVDVKALGVDFYSFSWYKVRHLLFNRSRHTWLTAQVYGPHIAALYGSQDAQQNVTSLGHYFHTPADNLATKLGLAAASYELVATIPSILAYFGPDRKKTWSAITAHEQRLQEILLDYLTKREDVTVYGERSADSELRVPVVSFSVKGKSSKAVVEKVDGCSDFGIRWGHFYSKRMVDDLLGLKTDGVIRVSMVHYNTGMSIRSILADISCVS
ncbi:MAG: hypothetical protein LQ338_001243 [Usnochroma carphineum]|nr:MAG: hypothetical protein LQ338_001243 [Usnochroma carphineum]